MKRILVFSAILAAGSLLSLSAAAQTRATATQTVTLAINAIYKLNVSGSPTLSITDATPGSGSLLSVSDATSTFSITQNQGTARLSVQLSSALPSGQTLTISVPSGLGTSAGVVPIEDGTAHNVMTGLAQGASNGQSITYTFGALSVAVPSPATAYTVTWTLAD